MLHSDLLLMQILIDLSGYCLTSKSIKMLRDLVEVLPFLYGIPIGCQFVITWFNLLEILHEIAELFVLVIVYPILYYLCNLLCLLSISFIPYILIFLYQSSKALLQSLLEFLKKVRMGLLWIHWSLLESIQCFCPQLVFNIADLAFFNGALYKFPDFMLHEVSCFFDCLQPFASTHIKPCAFYIRQSTLINSFHIPLA